jgi:hypothetical protein
LPSAGCSGSGSRQRHGRLRHADLVREQQQRRSSNANSLGGQYLAGFPEICAIFQIYNLRRHSPCRRGLPLRSVDNRPGGFGEVHSHLRAPTDPHFNRSRRLEGGLFQEKAPERLCIRGLHAPRQPRGEQSAGRDRQNGNGHSGSNEKPRSGGSRASWDLIDDTGELGASPLTGPIQ